ncbi:MAG: YciI family protein, partial [Acetobacteraceae bacterium]|nr:YciI family protein [Acetobacteraceae bacterium]
APEGRMIGSLMALALPDEAAARAWLAEEPYVTEGVWQDIRIERWRIGAQPYHPLPGAA